MLFILQSQKKSVISQHYVAEPKLIIWYWNPRKFSTYICVVFSQLWRVYLILKFIELFFWIRTEPSRKIFILQDVISILFLLLQIRIQTYSLLSCPRWFGKIDGLLKSTRIVQQKPFLSDKFKRNLHWHCSMSLIGFPAGKVWSGLSNHSLAASSKSEPQSWNSLMSYF